MAEDEIINSEDSDKGGNNQISLSTTHINTAVSSPPSRKRRAKKQ
jgi:hypothetical protein